MSPITHLLAGWTLGEAAGVPQRERALITLAGVLPDADGTGLVVELATRHSAHPLTWWSDYHHVLGHNLLFSLVVAGLCYATAKLKKRRTAFLAWVSFHLHLVCDLAGSRGPDGYQWPIPYLWPFSHAGDLVWSGQWQLNAWQNIFISAMLMMIIFRLAWLRSHSPLELIHDRLNTAFVNALRGRFGQPTTPVTT